MSLEVARHHDFRSCVAPLSHTAPSKPGSHVQRPVAVLHVPTPEQRAVEGYTVVKSPLYTQVELVWHLPAKQPRSTPQANRNADHMRRHQREQLTKLKEGSRTLRAVRAGELREAVTCSIGLTNAIAGAQVRARGVGRPHGGRNQRDQQKPTNRATAQRPARTLPGPRSGSAYHSISRSMNEESRQGASAGYASGLCKTLITTWRER